LRHLKWQGTVLNVGKSFVESKMKNEVTSDIAHITHQQTKTRQLQRWTKNYKYPKMTCGSSHNRIEGRQHHQYTDKTGFSILRKLRRDVN